MTHDLLGTLFPCASTSTKSHCQTSIFRTRTCAFSSKDTKSNFFWVVRYTAALHSTDRKPPHAILLLPGKSPRYTEGAIANAKLCAAGGVQLVSRSLTKQTQHDINPPKFLATSSYFQTFRVGSTLTALYLQSTFPHMLFLPILCCCCWCCC